MVISYSHSQLFHHLREHYEFSNDQLPVGLIAQLVRALDPHRRGHGFESCSSRNFFRLFFYHNAYFIYSLSFESNLGGRYRKRWAKRIHGNIASPKNKRKVELTSVSKAAKRVQHVEFNSVKRR